MRNLFVLCIVFLSMATATLAQVVISTDNSTPDNSAMLDVKSTTKGTLLSRMTQEQIQAISAPANGLQVYCTDNGKMYIYVATLGQWKEIAYGTGTLTPPFICGIPVTINHTAGTVAPVTKTVTYGTVTGIPGEPSKCWITSNLGADHQATAVNDNTEASAGWYWQFNRKQGYKHDGTVRTPNTTWIPDITENSDWISDNDPCTIELGPDWRIPTYTEWNNVYSGGGWTNWNGPWNSGLKLHAAGYLFYHDGMAEDRGSGGYIWSNTQIFDFYGGLLRLASWGCSLGGGYKSGGISVRCIRD
jgi:hypothetical protein